MAKHNRIGKIGEDLAVKWLSKNNFDLVERNYREKWGEIDIIARLPAQIGGEYTLHFIEVKSVSYETMNDLQDSVSRGTYRPEDNVTREKLKKLHRAIETWLSKNNYKGLYQLDVITVQIVSREKYAQIKRIENVILE